MLEGRCISVHYIGQHRAYQAKTCSLSAPLPFVLVLFPVSITLSYVVICLDPPALHQNHPSSLCSTRSHLSILYVCQTWAFACIICNWSWPLYGMRRQFHLENCDSHYFIKYSVLNTGCVQSEMSHEQLDGFSWKLAPKLSDQSFGDPIAQLLGQNVNLPNT